MVYLRWRLKREKKEPEMSQNMPHMDMITEMAIFRRYRSLLLKTLCYVGTKLGTPGVSFTQSEQLYIFCGRVLALSYFRIPELGKLISENLDEVTLPLRDWQKNLGTNPQQESDNLPEPVRKGKYFPNIFRGVLLSRFSEEETLQAKALSRHQLWITILWKREALFNIFLKEWISYISAQENPKTPPIPWRQIPGFRAVQLGILEKMRDEVTWSNFTVEAGNFMLKADPVIINDYIRVLFARTAVYSPPTVLGLFNLNLH